VVDAWDGDRLKALRVRRLLTQGELAQRVGVERKAVNRWESNKTKPRLTNIRALCEALEVTPEVLLDV
jgi:transcriptional regulator with XRE-family HTH domain